MKRVTALIIALLVHALTVAFVVLGGWTIAVNAEFAVAWVLGGLLIGVGWLLRPRLGRLPGDAEVLGRESAGELYGTAERVADRIGVKRPAKVAVRDLAPAASYQKMGLLRTPVLVIGLPLWLALPPRQRVTLLAMAYAGSATGDGVIVGGALSTLAEWRGALMGAEPLRVREEAEVKIAATFPALEAPGTGYHAAGFLGRMIGRVLGAPVLLLEYGLTRLARSGDAEAAQRRLVLARRVSTPEEIAELEELITSHRYLAPMQAAVLRGENVTAIRQGALARFGTQQAGVFASPNAVLLGTAESDRIDAELLRHYTRAIRGFGLIT
ncbi:hypothetical protein [Nonomuraea sp. SBT364]|uniref:hypothetical protein n=1 Tax=Nonomuraea sp. SBT364 TaxID=1580530 RepID=UPI00066AF95F|nr:hypothetical protein [Nonomuraea sp. SBT364]